MSLINNNGYKINESELYFKTSSNKMRRKSLAITSQYNNSRPEFF